MAEVALYQNFGGVLFRDAAPDQQANEIEFPNAWGRITQTTVYNFDYQNNQGDRIRSIKGYRVSAELTIKLLDQTVVTKMYNLFNMFNSLANVGGLELPIYIYPRYDSTKPVNDYYAMFRTSPISPEDIARVQIGQTFNFSFESEVLQNRLSTTIDILQEQMQLTIAGTQTDADITI